MIIPICVIAGDDVVGEFAFSPAMAPNAPAGSTDLKFDRRACIAGRLVSNRQAASPRTEQ